MLNERLNEQTKVHENLSNLSVVSSSTFFRYYDRAEAEGGERLQRMNVGSVCRIRK